MLIHEAELNHKVIVIQIIYNCHPYHTAATQLVIKSKKVFPKNKQLKQNKTHFYQKRAGSGPDMGSVRPLEDLRDQTETDLSGPEQASWECQAQARLIYMYNCIPRLDLIDSCLLSRPSLFLYQ